MFPCMEEKKCFSFANSALAIHSIFSLGNVQVISSQFMAFYAMGFEPMEITKRKTARSMQIVALADCTEMSTIHAGMISADVVYVELLRNCTIREFVSNTMSP